MQPAEEEFSRHNTFTEDAVVATPRETRELAVIADRCAPSSDAPSGRPTLSHHASRSEHRQLQQIPGTTDVISAQRVGTPGAATNESSSGWIHGGQPTFPKEQDELSDDSLGS